ncbi:MAG: hypothetical protein KKH91_08010 [Elusimicrobia bacterium]|nr:hypothetical protein [Elusimicrobiota bacterium]MBU2613941.1 hypothetical protein [Elusimicrobiota bacterium]
MIKKRIKLFLFIFAVSAVSAVHSFSDEFDLQLKKVYPKIVTPSYGVQDNNYVFFEFYDPQYENAKLNIFSLDGYKVREIFSSQRIAKAGSLDWCFVWDCRDSKGAVINPGVYLYLFQSKNKNYNGTIIVAR